MSNPPDDGPKVVQMPQPKNQVMAAGDEIRRNFDALVANAVTIAKYRRASYLVHVEAGFTEAQALELCCK